MAEDKVRQLQKMEAVGQLTGGVAHDFNNMLTVIMSGLNMLMAKLARGDHNIQRYADLALEGTNRAAELTHRLLAFSRQQPLVPEVINLNRLVSGLSELLQRTLGGSYQLEIIRHAGLCFTQADISSLEQAVVNLCVNARDAMEEGGAITVETGNVYLDDHYALEEGVPAGEYVMVAVSDTGTGIDAETLMRVFEPYFTTKPVGRGTGRGLSQVYGFVAQSYGHLKMYSEVGYATPSFTTAAWTEACSCYLSRSHCATSQSRCAKCLIHNLSSIGNNLSQTHGSNTYDPLLLFRHVPK